MMSSKDKNDDILDDDLDWENEDGDSLNSDVDMSPPRRPEVQRQRDWRDLERYREERELKKLMEDDYWLED